jgi:Methyltransferase domain
MNKIGSEIYEGIKPSGNKQVFGWNSYSDIFRNLVVETRPSVVVEVGTWLGASAIHMAKVVKELSLGTKIYCVDTWLGAQEFWTWGSGTQERNLRLRNGYPQVYYDFLGNVVEHGVQDIIVPVPNTSYIGSMILGSMGVEADLIYVDASHEYVDVKSDIASYSRLLKRNGIMFGDDMNDHWPGVKRAVIESFGTDFDVYQNNFWKHRKKG